MRPNAPPTALLPLALALLSPSPPSEARAAPPPDAGKPSDGGAKQAGAISHEQGRALLTTFECHRCHEGTGLPAIAKEKQCVGCHQDIIADRFGAPAKVIAEWRSHLVSLREAPSLTAIGARLNRAWVKRMLLNPEDCRPALLATMPRLAITEPAADAIASYLVPSEAPAEKMDAALVEEGKKLYAELRCATCHRFTGSPADVLPPEPEDPNARRKKTPKAQPKSAKGKKPEPPPPAVALAPDLSLTRERVQSGALAAWLKEPLQVMSDALMPEFPITEREIRALAAFVLLEPLALPPLPAAIARKPVLARRVSFDEVSAKVFRKVCWHCHSQPDYARGDGGPGNSGGFGYPPRGLDLSSYTGVAAGSIGPDGERRSIFLPLPDGTPRLLAHLLARRDEEQGRSVPGVTGMPLALPSLDADAVQLVESWIAQGRPE